LISVWQLGSAHWAGYLTVIHLGSHVNLRRMTHFSSRPLPLLAAGRAALRFGFPGNFSARPSQPELDGRAQFPDA